MSAGSLISVIAATPLSQGPERVNQLLELATRCIYSARKYPCRVGGWGLRMLAGLRRIPMEWDVLAARKSRRGGTDVLSEAAMAGQNPSPTIVERLVLASRDPMLRKAVSFGLIGVINTLIDYSVFWIAYSYVGVPQAIANVLSLFPLAMADMLAWLPLAVTNVPAWLVAVSCSYMMNSFVTFAAESGRRLRWRDYRAFVVSGVAGLIANTATLVVFAYIVPVPAAKLFAIGVSFLVNFSLSHFVVFRPRRPAAKEPR
jgi:putative flippase GtrA